MTEAPASAGPEVVLVKLGGSLITDKRGVRSSRPEVIERLAEELTRARQETGIAVVLGHGSGSYGHESAARHQLGQGLSDPAQRAGIGETQRAAAELHRQVLEALARAGENPYSISPSSAVLAEAGSPCCFLSAPLLTALDHGLLPVVYGDVVMDRTQGVAIASTESVLLLVAQRLLAHGHRVERALWLGETPGVFDASGAVLPEIRRGDLAGLAEDLVGAAGTDVTGGMRHRVEKALAFSDLGIASWICDGREEGLLARALAGHEVPATVVAADPQ